MPLSKELLNHMSELEKIKNWEKLPNDDPRIAKLHELSAKTEKVDKKLGNHKLVVVKRNGKFIQAYNSASEAAEALGMSAEAVRKISRGERRPPEGFEIDYIQSEVH